MTFLFGGAPSYTPPPQSAPPPPPPPLPPPPEYPDTQKAVGETQSRQRAAAALAAGRESTILGGRYRTKLGES